MLICTGSLTLFRMFMIIKFRSHLTHSVNPGDIFLAVAIGLRFDAAISGFVALPCIISSVVCGFFQINRICDRLRNIVAFFFILISMVIFLSNFLFFREFNDNFNHWVMGVVFDDFWAVIQSVSKDYHLPALLPALLGGALFVLYMVSGLLKNPFLSEHNSRKMIIARPAKIMMSVLGMIIFIIAIRGSVGIRPVQRKDAYITGDSFLNKLVMNPYYAMKYAVKHYETMQKAGGIKAYLPDGDIQSALKRYFNAASTHKDLDEYLKKQARGYAGKRPGQIFLIVMESMDSWPLLDQYRSLDLLPNLKRLGQEGITVNAFLPSGTGTMTSFATIVTGLPEAGVYTNYQPGSRKPFPTSLARQFNALGYETNLFYGGYLSWQRIGDFCREQGFANVYGGGNMGKWKNREWGVDDDALFNFILETVHPDKPSFNLILTTSNHTPYDLPVYEKGFKIRQMPDDLKSVYDGRVPLKVFGHLWYSDKLLGDFVRDIGLRCPDSVFAITGDHWSRKFLNANPTLYERASVPLVLYGPAILKNIVKPRIVAGSHIDIMPTLIELSASRGFEYFSMGTNLLDQERTPVGINSDFVITPKRVLDLNGNNEILPFAAQEVNPYDVNALESRQRAFSGIGWWRIMKGSELNPIVKSIPRGLPS